MQESKEIKKKDLKQDQVILVMGAEARTGKSTLINQIMGCEASPIRFDWCTKFPITFEYDVSCPEPVLKFESSFFQALQKMEQKLVKYILSGQKTFGLGVSDYARDLITNPICFLDKDIVSVRDLKNIFDMVMTVYWNDCLLYIWNDLAKALVKCDVNSCVIRLRMPKINAKSSLRIIDSPGTTVFWKRPDFLSPVMHRLMSSATTILYMERAENLYSAVYRKTEGEMRAFNEQTKLKNKVMFVLTHTDHVKTGVKVDEKEMAKRLLIDRPFSKFVATGPIFLSSVWPCWIGSSEKSGHLS